MKKMSNRKRSADEAVDIRAEYAFDYRKARANRFAPLRNGAVAVVLDPDVASVFQTAEAVNSVLRWVISALPQARRNRRADLL